MHIRQAQKLIAFEKKKWNKTVLQICFSDRCELEMAKTSHVEQYVSFMWGVVCIRRIQDLFGHTLFLKIKVMSQQLEFIGYILCIVVREYTSGHCIWIDFDPNDERLLLGVMCLNIRADTKVISAAVGRSLTFLHVTTYCAITKFPETVYRYDTRVIKISIW